MPYVSGWIVCSRLVWTCCRYVVTSRTPSPPFAAIPFMGGATKYIHLTDTSIDLHPPITSIKFHWNDYSDNGYITALQQLQVLQGEGLITALGLCNFDAKRMDEICTILGPRSIVSNQIQVRLDRASFLPPFFKSQSGAAITRYHAR